MKIEIYPIRESMTIEEFAEQHNLIMEVHERARSMKDTARYYAHFKNAEVSQGQFLCSTYGDGKTPEEAIIDYARSISGETLILNACTVSRRRIKVPHLRG